MGLPGIIVEVRAYTRQHLTSVYPVSRGVVYRILTRLSPLLRSEHAVPMSKASLIILVCFSPRVLHFNDDQMYWQCSDVRTAELEQKLPPGIFRVFELLKVPESKTESQSHDPLVARGILGLWMDLVSQYTNCSLTYESDKLVAISALGKLFKTNVNLNQRYLAGIWEDTLPMGLMWYRPPSSSSSRPTEYRAPSWSWASINGVVDPLYDRDLGYRQELVTITDVSVTTKSHDPFGMVIDGYLILEGYLAGGTDSDRHEHLVWDIEEESKVYGRDSLVYIPLVSHSEGINGLVLTPVVTKTPDMEGESDGGQGLFRRVGLFDWQRHTATSWGLLRYEDVVDELGIPAKRWIWPDPEIKLETIKII